MAGRHSSKMTYITFKLAAKTYFQVSKVKMDSGFQWRNSENLGFKRKNAHYFFFLQTTKNHTCCRYMEVWGLKIKGVQIYRNLLWCLQTELPHTPLA